MCLKIIWYLIGALKTILVCEKCLLLTIQIVGLEKMIAMENINSYAYNQTSNEYNFDIK